MELKEQVISPEQSKTLAQLGFVKHSIFQHIYNYSDWEFKYTRLSGQMFDTADMKHTLPAYTVSELMEYLPHSIKQPNGSNAPLWMGRNGYGKYIVEYHIVFEKPHKTIMEDNLAQALGDMLIYLIENKYISI